MKQISIALAKWHGVIASVERDEESGSDTDDTLSTGGVAKSGREKDGGDARHC